MTRFSDPRHTDLVRLPERTRRELERYARAALITPEELVDRVLTAHFRTLEKGIADNSEHTIAGSETPHSGPSDGFAGLDHQSSTRSFRRSKRAGVDDRTPDLFSYELIPPEEQKPVPARIDQSTTVELVDSSPSSGEAVFSVPNSGTPAISFSERIMPEYASMLGLNDTSAGLLSVTESTVWGRSRIKPGSFVEYETTDPVTQMLKRMRVFIMRSPDDQISEAGVLMIGDANPVARALLDAEEGDEVFLDEGGKNARSLRVIRVW